MKPKYVWAYYRRGKTYSCRGKYDHAVSDYTKAIGIDPKAIADRSKDDYAKLWEDVRKAKGMEYQIDLGFLKALRKASGREE